MADDSRRLRVFAPALVLLTLSVLISYVDRGNLSIAAPLLKDELNISVSRLGILLSAFFWTYTARLFVSGWLVDRFDVNLVIAAGYLLWSLATATTGIVQGFTMLLVMRLILGVGESVTFPSCSKILARHLPEHYRGFANGAIAAGYRCGPAMGTFVGGLLMAKYGWRPVFLGIGLVSLAWLPGWMKWMPRGQGMTPHLGVTPGLADILRQRSFWGTWAGQLLDSVGVKYCFPIFAHEDQMDVKLKNTVPTMSNIACQHHRPNAIIPALPWPEGRSNIVFTPTASSGTSCKRPSTCVENCTTLACKSVERLGRRTVKVSAT